MTKSDQYSPKPYYRISSLEKGLKIIELLAEKQNLTVTEVSRELGQDRSTCNRFLLTLKELGYVVTNSQARYRPTLKMFEIGNKIAEIIEIRLVARTYMKKLATRFKETVNLGRKDGFDIVTIEVVSSQEVIRFDAPIGNRSPIHTLSMGKAILAFRPIEEQKAYLATTDFQSFTPNTITSKYIFVRELSKIHEQGYAIDNEEWALGIRCVAAPVLDYAENPSHAISISGPSLRMTDEKIAQIIPQLTSICISLSTELGAKSS